MGRIAYPSLDFRLDLFGARVWAMSKPKLYYFDAPMSRGEECRLALHLAGVDFEDVRLKRDAWAAYKPTTPFGSMPVLEMPGQPPLAQSNAILVLIGRLHGLHPTDLFEAARHEAAMAHVEDLRAHISPTMRISDEAEKKKAREALATGYLPTWAANLEKHIGDGPFFGGAKISVVDLKILMAVTWIRGGALDHIPTTVFDAYPKVIRVYEAVRAHEGVKAWYGKTQ
jgi:prostaglandin-H2 D-isomerase / glutathione transferase